MDIRSTNPENLDRLLKTVGSKLNMPPERLKRELMQGKFDSAIKNMKPDEAQKFNAVLSNPQMLEKLMSAPQAQATISVLRVDTKKDVFTITRAAEINEYLLNLRVDAQASRNGEPLGEPMTVVVQRTMEYADSEVLGKQEEEATIWAEMRTDAAVLRNGDQRDRAVTGPQHTRNTVAARST